MAQSAMGQDLLDVLRMFRSGAAQVVARGELLAAVDVDARKVRVDVQPFLEEWRGFLRSLPKGPSDLRDHSHLPRDLAREGWEIDLYDGDKEVARIGRGTSALTGHVHIHLAVYRLLKDLL